LLVPFIWSFYIKESKSVEENTRREKIRKDSPSPK